MEQLRRVQCVFFAIFICSVYFSNNVLADKEETTKSFSLRIPNIQPLLPDTYLCTAIRIDPTKEYYITAFEPSSTMDVAHHILLFGCYDGPGTEEDVWQCGNMETEEKRDNRFMNGSSCAADQRATMYAWARNAPKLDLPDDVAYKVGGKNKIQHFVMQVHYATVERYKDGSTDDSGIIIHYSSVPRPNTAGVFALVSRGRILPHSTEYWESMCNITEDVELHPFAYRVHTHDLGLLVSGYKVEKEPNSLFEKWTLLGKKDPLLPQMFYKTLANVTLTKGDIVASRCTFYNKRDHIVTEGASFQDEMCFFYVMYWTKGELFSKSHCVYPGPPFFGWGRFGLTMVPDKDASTIGEGDSAIDYSINKIN